MPKIITDAKTKILEQAKANLFEKGYHAISIRNLAQECQMAVGTIYNYFPDKDTLIATILLEDWMQAIETMKQDCSSIEEGILHIYQSIQTFANKYQNLFEQASSSMHIIQTRHHMLVQQINEQLLQLLNKFNQPLCLSNILSECILTCATQNTVSSNDFMYMMHLLFRKER